MGPKEDPALVLYIILRKVNKITTPIPQLAVLDITLPYCWLALCMARRLLFFFVSFDMGKARTTDEERTKKKKWVIMSGQSFHVMSVLYNTLRHLVSYIIIRVLFSTRSANIKVGLCEPTISSLSSLQLASLMISRLQ